MKSIDDLLARIPEMQARAKARNAQELPNGLGLDGTASAPATSTQGEPIDSEPVAPKRRGAPKGVSSFSVQ